MNQVSTLAKQAGRAGLVRSVRASPETVRNATERLHRSRLGGLVLDRLWPAFLFCLILLVRADNVHTVLANWPVALAPEESAVFAAWLLHQALSLAFLGLVVILFVIRRPVIGRRSDWTGTAVALGGTFVLMVIGGSEPLPPGARVLPLASLLVIAGTLFSGIALLSLNTCFGLLPEARGLVTRGPYRLVRHPVYLGEVVAGLGITLSAPALHSFVAFALFVGLQYWRAVNEEAALAAVFPEYAAYCARTRRFVPGLH